MANRFTEVNQEEFVKWDQKDFLAEINTVGYDWKSFDFTSGEFIVSDDIVFFVKTFDGDVYKLYFTAFVGQEEGKFVFQKGLISPSATIDIDQANTIQVYPNPFTSEIHLNFESKLNEAASVQVLTANGKLISTNQIPPSTDTFVVPVNDLTSGIYIVQLSCGDKIWIKKLIKK